MTGVGGEGYPSQVSAFEGNLAVGSTYIGTNWSDWHAYLYNMSKPINPSNPIVIVDQSDSSANGISGDYVIGEYYSTTPIIAPPPASAPTVSSGGGGGGGSSSKKKSASKSSVKKPSTKKKSTKKRK